jgi:Skp family chaperone for outer membrane proteins
MRNSLVSLAALAVGLSALAAAPAPAADAPPPAAKDLRIAVVDWPQLINGLAEWKDRQETLRQKNQEMERVERDLRRRIEVVNSEMKDLALGTEDRALKEEELDRLRTELRTKMEFYKRQIQRQIGVYLEEIYRKVITEVARYAEEKGYDLVLKKQSLELTPTAVSIRSQIDMSTVLYAGSQADVTEELLKILNEKYGKSVEVK